MSPTSYQAALPRVIPSLLSATLIIIPYSNGFVKRVRKVFLQRKQRMKMRLPTFFPESQQPRQFTPLREGRPVPFPQISTNSWRFQFTPLREGRPACHLTRRHLLISIHAPPRGATVHGVCWGYWNLISIHAPPRGATAGGRPRSPAPAYFNSRPSARGDRPRPDNQFFFIDFNSRPSARGDCVARA